MNATLDELSELFECDPDFQGLENEKPYAYAKFQTTSEDVRIILNIMAPTGEFSLKAFRNDKLFFDFQSSSSAVVKADLFDGKHLLVIEDGNKTQTYIRIKPDFFVGHEIKGY